MPKLSKAAAKQVENAEAAAGFAPLPEGRYAAQLRSVTEKERKDGKKYPYWVWEYHNLHNEDGQAQPGRMWNNTSLSPDAARYLKATFEAFGYTSDSDTDEIIGEWVVLYIAKTVIASGVKAGQPTNEVRQVLPFEPGDWPFDPESVQGSADSGDDVF